MDALESALTSIEPVQIDSDALANFTDEGEFIGLGISLLAEVGAYVCVAASIYPDSPKGWDRSRAIIGGNLVRLYKLISAVLDQTSQGRGDTTLIFMRCAYETIVNIKYFVLNASPELFDSYVRYSLKYEKKLHNKVLADIRDGGGEENTIQRRILNSIERTVAISEVDLADLSVKEPRNWGGKNLFERAEETDLKFAYLAAMGQGSNNVHGNWSDLFQNHLERTEHGFRAHLDWQRPRPQPLFFIALLVLETIEDYFTHINVGMGDRLKGLSERVQQVDTAHENYLIARKDRG